MPPTRSLPHLSASGVNQFIGCRLQWYYERILQLPKPFISPALVFGSLFHRLVAETLVVGRTPDLEAIRAQWTQQLEHDTVRFDTKDDPAEYPALAQRMLDAYLAEVQHYQIECFEKAFLVDLGLQAPLVGALDLIERTPDGGVLIVEIKTARASYSDQKLGHHLQAALYSLAAEELYGQDAVLCIDLVTKTRQPKAFRYFLDHDPIGRQQTRALLAAVEEDMLTGPIYPNKEDNFRCPNCPYNTPELCQSWHG